MGKLVQVNTGFSDVSLPPLGLPFNAGQTTTLTDAEYAALPAATTRAITVNSSPADPARPVISNPVSLADAVTQANNYTNTKTGAVTGNVQTANYTLALADAGTVAEMNSSSAITLTVPPNSSVAFPIGTLVEVFQYGSGQVTLAPGAGVTIRTPSSLTTRVQYASVSLRKRGTDEWVASGDLT